MINHLSIKENVTFITYVANKCNNNRHCIFEKPEIVYALSLPPPISL